MELDARSNTILQHVVESFIDDAQPVSSGVVAGRLRDLNASPATIRSVMADLESLGLLRQPHTSAGRVPTEKGLRAYLDNLVKPRLRRRDRNRLEQAASATHLADFPASLGQSLAGLSGQVAVVAVPRFLGTRFKEVALVRHDTHRFLAIFVSQGGLVQQKMVEVDFDLDNEQLLCAQNFLNEQLETRSVAELRQLIREELEGHRSQVAQLRRVALEIVARVLPGPPTTEDMEVIVEGASHLVGQPEFSDLDRLRGLLGAIEGRKALLELLARILDGYGVQVMLGSEHHVRDLPAVACVGVPMVDPDGHPAAVTLLGPARMDYGRLVPLVDFAAQLFGRYWTKI
ncbi:heat-inducible transcriptional repressor HrcA [Myxococcota bacterium]